MTARTEHLILVIDDEQVVLDASARILKAEGFEVATALDAERGLEATASKAPDLAVVDLKLPGMSGLEFLDAALAANSDLIVILTTGVSTADQAVAALNHGAFDFLPKPFTYEELMSPVLRGYRYRKLLGKGGAGVAAPFTADLLFLGLQAWARPQQGKRMQLGVSDLFQRTAGSVCEVLLPKINAELRQGAPLARVRSEDGHWHVALAAAAGRIAKVNSELTEKPQLLNEDAFAAGWIAEVQSAEFYRDLPNLRSSEELA